MADKWIQKATSKNKGVFKKKAEDAGMSTDAYARQVTKKGSTASTKTKEEAKLSKTLAKMRKKKKQIKFKLSEFANFFDVTDLTRLTETLVSSEDLIAYYELHMPELGWQQRSDIDSGDDNTTLAFQNATDFAYIRIESLGTNIKVTIHVFKIHGTG